jgi:patatin-like phospholipase/acyl hydrolase
LTRRILSIDGGGIKGVFPASFLATVEDSIEGRVADYFDIIVGTSTGGIIALGLGLGLSASDILRFYEDSGPKIFGGNRLIRSIRRLRTAKYSNRLLRDALESVLGERKLGESSKRLVIPSLNLENGEVYIYKTAHHPRFERDYRMKAADVALATAAAPTFFPTHRSAVGTPLIDGGVWTNNPTGLAAVEAIGVLDWPKDSLRVLSLGCTSVVMDKTVSHLIVVFQWLLATSSESFL